MVIPCKHEDDEQSNIEDNDNIMKVDSIAMGNDDGDDGDDDISLS